MRFARFSLLGFLLWCATGRLNAERLSPLATARDWRLLAAAERALTPDEFFHLLETVYAPEHAADPWVQWDGVQVALQASGADRCTVPLAATAASVKIPPRYWRPLPTESADARRPLAGVTVAIDPGHLGGVYARMEERWFQCDGAPPVQEGELTLRVAKVLQPLLEALGAHAVLVRSNAEPLTPLRPENLRDAAARLLEGSDPGHPPLPGYQGPNDPEKEHSIEWQAERLFYRVAEIRERAVRVNDVLRPDLVICLHFNAEPWGDPDHPELVEANHLHLLVNGDYSPGELAYDDVRFEMWQRLLGRTHEEELAVAEAVAGALARATGLPPYQYHSPNAVPVGTSGYVWARNLLANRLYQCPVVYTECYVMNSRGFVERYQAGEYDGLRWFAGAWHENLFREYANGIADGLKNYCAGRR
ncbi:MAG TPA: hypothetical protein VGD78_03680 [Chthoniobacterales bacterium]